jgi:hypothetical protein
MGIDERAERREREAFDRGLLNGASVLFDMVDDLDLALRALSQAEAPEEIASGLVLSRARVIERFYEIGFETIDPLDDVFNPHLHEAVMLDIYATVPDGIVCEVQRRGWMHGSLCVRPAMVIVSGAAPVYGPARKPEPEPYQPTAVPAAADLSGLDALSTVLDGEAADDEEDENDTPPRRRPVDRKRRRGVNDIFGLSRSRQA